MWKTCGKGLQAGMLFLISLLTLGNPVQASPLTLRPFPAGEDDQAIHFSFGGFHFDDKLLVFEYTVKYPGVTDLIMTDAEGNVVWRNRYVDDKAGPQKITLNTEKMKGGSTYVFKFEFKRDRVMRAVTIP